MLKTERVKTICAACGKEGTRALKPEPKTAREKKEIAFLCRFCGAANLRDGTAVLRDKKPKKPKLAARPAPEKSAPRPKEPQASQEIQAVSQETPAEPGQEKPGEVQDKPNVFPYLLLGGLAAVAAFILKKSKKPQEAPQEPPAPGPQDFLRSVRS